MIWHAHSDQLNSTLLSHAWTSRLIWLGLLGINPTRSMIGYTLRCLVTNLTFLWQSSSRAKRTSSLTCKMIWQARSIVWQSRWTSTMLRTTNLMCLSGIISSSCQLTLSIWRLTTQDCMILVPTTQWWTTACFTWCQVCPSKCYQNTQPTVTFS